MMNATDVPYETLFRGADPLSHTGQHISLASTPYHPNLSHIPSHIPILLTYRIQYHTNLSHIPCLDGWLDDFMA